jgi:hypothetical protein
MNLKVLIFHDILLWYPHKKSEIMQIVKPAIIMMIFNTSTSYFHKILFHCFKRLFKDKTNPTLKYYHIHVTNQRMAFLQLTLLSGSKL